MMDERTFEEKLDEMLAEAARMTEEEPVDMDNQTIDDDGKEIVFSKEHERRMKKISIQQMYQLQELCDHNSFFSIHK